MSTKTPLEYVESIQNDFELLAVFRQGIEKKGLQTKNWESYTRALNHMIDLLLENKTTIEPIETERTYFSWLKICVNPSKEINYDFYFEKYELNKEKQVTQILFDKDGQLRGIFKSTERQSTEWQIRLRTIADWFLKRYDFTTASKILKNIDSNHKTIFDKIKLFSPRLWGAIFIGFLPLIMGQETWELPLKLGWNWVIGLSMFFLIITLLYLCLECFNITRDCKTAFKRALIVWGEGIIFSLCSSVCLIYIMWKHFVGDKIEKMEMVWNFYGIPIYRENIIFFASAALLIGIFIQVFWEEKTITEPL